MDLPPQLVERRDVVMSAEQKEAYATLKRDCILALEKGEVTAVNEAVLRLKLIQIACGAVYDGDHQVNKLNAADRIDVLREVMQECREKIIVFSPLTSVVHMLKAELAADYECATITGATSAKERAVIFSDFQEKTAPRVLIADPGTMAHGLTLVAATCIIWFAPTDRTELYLQANKRIDRPGQTKTNVVVQLAATNIEREIFRRLEANESMQGLVLKLAEGGNRGDNGGNDDR
jgi:SNF2 family DNA or RNA helicase